jgi:hypothetical protein
MFFSKLLENYPRSAKKTETLAAALEYVLLVHRNLLDGSSGHFKKVFNVILKKFLINIISPVSFQLNRGENTIAQQRNILKIKKKTVEVLSYSRSGTINFSKKIEFYLVTQSL